MFLFFLIGQMRLLCLVASCIFLLIAFPVFAEENDFYLTPQAEDTAEYLRAVQRISASGGQVRDQYDEESYAMGGSSKNPHQLGNQVASGVMNWNTLIDYFVYAVRFMSQLALLFGAVMIIYTGYKYALASVTGEPNNDGIKNAVYGILVVIFAYAIIKILTIAFLV